MRIHSTLAFVTLLSASLSAQVPSYVPSNGLVGWWPFNGNANDESGNGNDGTVNNATPAPDRGGNSSSAYQFNGTNSRIVVGDPADGDLDMLGGPLSISLWVLTTESALSSLVTKQNTSIPNSSGDYNLDMNDLGQVRMAMGFGGGQGEARVSNTLVNDGLWHHVVAIYSPTAIDLYVDGVLATSGSNTIVAPLVLDDSPQPLQFGIAVPDTTPHNGKLDDIGVWNRSLDECEIQALYNAGSQGVSPTPVSFSGLNSSYTLADAPSTLVGSPPGGVFIGPGVTGNSFDPAAAGVGSHSVTYAYVDACGSVNVQSFCTEVLLNVGAGGSQLSTGGVHVYPNPNRGQFTVELELAGLVGLQVYDARGALVHNEVFTASGSRTQRMLDLSTLAQGSYTILVQHDGQRISQTVVLE